MHKPMVHLSFVILLLTVWSQIEDVKGACERSSKLMGAEEVCWSSKVKLGDRIQYTTKSVLNFAKEKLGLSTDEPFYPQECDYYHCIFGEMKMLTNGYPDYEKIVEWVDSNVIYKHAKTQYDRIKECNEALNMAIDTNQYFSGDLTPQEGTKMQNKCLVAQEFMKCISNNGTCIIFTYP